jgi:vitamin B12 transporter
MATSRIPYLQPGWGIFFRPASALILSTPRCQPHHRSQTPYRLGRGRCLGRVRPLSTMSRNWTASVLDDPEERDVHHSRGTVVSRTAGVQRGFVVGLSVVCLNIVGTGDQLVPLVERKIERSVVAAAELTRLDPVVVTSTQIAVPLSELPSAITVIDREEIESRQITDVQQLLRTVPGLSVTQSGSRGGATNVFPRGGNSNFSLVLIGGVPVNDAGGAYDFSDLTTDNIERIEVIRGPQSALYGSNAIGAVIQIFTRRGRGPLQGDVSLTAGTFNTYEGHGTISGGTERFGGSLGVGYVSTSGFLPINNDYRDFSISSGLDYQPIETLKMAFNARYSDSHFEFPTGSGGDRLSPLDPNQFQDRQRLVLSLRTTHAITRWWEHVLLLGYSRNDSLFRDPLDPEDFADSQTDSEEQRLFLKYFWNVSLPEFYQVMPTWSLGIEAQGEKLEQRSTFGTTTTNIDPSRSQQGYYTQMLLNWRKQATLLAGVRVEDNSVCGVDTNPRVSASYTLPWSQTKIRGGYATGIRAPSFVENFGTGDPSFVGNPDLKPEESDSWEIGLDQPLFAGRALLSATYFANTFKDLITFVSGPGPNWRNIQEAESSGIEAGFQVFLPWQLRLDGSYTFLETKVLDDGGLGGTFFPPGQPLLRRPKHQGSVGLTYLGERATVSFIANVVGSAIDRDFSQPGSPRVTLPGHTKLDLAGSYMVVQHAWKIKNIRLQMKIENLLNESYEEVLGFSAAGISVRGGIAASF